MSIESRLKRLEAKHAPGQCPHLPHEVRYFNPDGSEETSRAWPPPEHPAPAGHRCPCGCDRLTIRVQYVDDWRALT
jgi:hypothetical protein